ncbi:MAG TPA: RsiV family protein [Mobilitalea sp.]|nr:RsiV family protein [Mobilitalea sp.]
MSKLKDAKEIFDKIEIPKELDQIVTNAIKDHPANKNDIQKYNVKKRNGYVIRRAAAAAAGVLICFTVALNSSEAFAKSIGKLPVIGGLAKVLTVRSYHSSEDNKNISVNVPQIKVDGTDNNQDASTAAAQNQDTSPKDVSQGQTADQANASAGTGAATSEEGTNQFVADINAEINSIVNTYMEDAKKRMQADKDAFLATGGTKEEWAKRDLNINVDYEVKYQQGNLLSLILSADESWYGAYDLKYFYNLDLKNNKKLTLKDILGEDYVTIANDSIIQQMKDKAAQDENIVYWGITDDGKSGIDGFTTVDENTKFYLNKDGKPVVCFDKYEVAPGFMGAQEFVVE